MPRRSALTRSLALGFVVTAVLGADGVTQAGPNRSGTLILALEPVIEFTTDVDYGDQATLDLCTEAVVDTPDEGTFLLFVYAAFAERSSPRLAGITFGIDYGPSEGPVLSSYGPTDGWEVPTSLWPSSPGSGTTITWVVPHLGLLTPVYWFGAYVYAADAPSTLRLIPHPLEGGTFFDDAVPPRVDPIGDYGVLGFLGAPGSLPCPVLEYAGCCLPDCSCFIAPMDECTAAGGLWTSGTVCDPNPCPCPPPGACCIGQDCAILEEADCWASNGYFVGSEVTCDSGACWFPATRQTTWGRIKSPTP